MNVVKVLAPFGLSAVLFVLAYLSLVQDLSGFFVMLLFGAGAIMAIIGAVALFSNGK